MRHFLAVLLAAAFLLLGVPTAAAADVDDFTFDSFEADYYLGVDESGHSTLRTIETFVARFPETDQNRGIRRALVEDYDGHPTDLTVTSVTDENGTARAFETDAEDGLLSVTIAADDYVHGAQTYVITYEQKNVTRFFEDTGVDEFYWDTNGTDWAQPFGAVTARVHVDPAIADRLTGELACYTGAEGSTEQCQIGEAGGVITASDAGLAPFENVTVAVAFEPGTFVARDGSYFANPISWVQLIALLAAIGAAIWGFAIRATVTRDADGRPTIVAEYLPPDGNDLLGSADIVGRSGRAIAAQLIDLAVHRRIRIIENEKPWAKDTFSLQLVTADGVTGLPRRLLTAFFGSGLRDGSEYELTGTDTKLGTRISSLQRSVHRDVVRRGLRRRVAAGQVIVPFIIAVIAAAIVLFTGNPDHRRQPWRCDSAAARDPGRSCGRRGRHLDLPPAAHRRRSRTARSPARHAPLHQGRRTGSAAGAAEPRGCAPHPGSRRRPSRDAETERADAAIRGVVQPGEGLGRATRCSVRGRPPGLVRQQPALQCGDLRRGCQRAQHLGQHGDREQHQRRIIRRRVVRRRRWRRRWRRGLTPRRVRQRHPEPAHRTKPVQPDAPRVRWPHDFALAGPTGHHRDGCLHPWFPV
ncbi:DUF2207 domain-containing protein [Diaminobutyricimonas sp. LJ205]|uniref:DUF2207 domain-containing protein n=1 Tax=Diaminobutyricimonas sp. LJ205 TaxID=2683590 RepID=UPI0012F4E42D|nr:DUF2207 domain-containing protein [Diaminobutyricimonas sp. LJ205]